MPTESLASQSITATLIARFNLAQDEKARAAIADYWLRSLPPRTLIALRGACGDGLVLSSISKHLGVPEPMVSLAVTHRGWLGKSKDRTADQRQRDAEQLETWRETVSAQAQDLALGALSVTRTAIDRGDAKSLANAARAASTLVGMARQAEGMDKRDAGAGSESLSISVFYIPAPTERLAEAKRVAEAEERAALDVSASPVADDASLF